MKLPPILALSASFGILVALAAVTAAEAPTRFLVEAAEAEYPNDSRAATFPTACGISATVVTAVLASVFLLSAPGAPMRASLPQPILVLVVALAAWLSPLAGYVLAHAPGAVAGIFRVAGEAVRGVGPWIRNMAEMTADEIRHARRQQAAGGRDLARGSRS